MAEREVEAWITVNGARVPIFKGQSKDEAIREAITGKKASKSGKLIDKPTNKLTDAEKKKLAEEQLKKNPNDQLAKHMLKQTETQKQISKDQDKKEEQIANNKKEAEQAGNKTIDYKKGHYDTVLNDIRSRLDKGELTPEQARDKAFEYEKSQRDNKKWSDVDRNRMESKVRDIFSSASKKEEQAKSSSDISSKLISEWAAKQDKIRKEDEALRNKLFGKKKG